MNNRKITNLILGAYKGELVERDMPSSDVRIDESIDSDDWIGLSNSYLGKYGENNNIRADFNNINDIEETRKSVSEIYGITGFQSIIFDYNTSYFFEVTIGIMGCYKNLLAKGGAFYIPFEPRNCCMFSEKALFDQKPTLENLRDIWFDSIYFNPKNTGNILPLSSRLSGYVGKSELKPHIEKLCVNYNIKVLTSIFGDHNVFYQSKVPGDNLEYPLKSYYDSQFKDYNQNYWIGLFVCIKTDDDDYDTSITQVLEQFQPLYHQAAWDEFEQSFLK